MTIIESYGRAAIDVLDRVCRDKKDRDAVIYVGMLVLYIGSAFTSMFPIALLTGNGYVGAFGAVALMEFAKPGLFRMGQWVDNQPRQERQKIPACRPARTAHKHANPAGME